MKAEAEQLRKLAASIEEIATAIESERGFRIEVTDISGLWRDLEAVQVFNSAWEYRVAYSPREYWANVYSPDQNISAHTSRADADKYATVGRTECIHLIEDPIGSEYFNG